MTPRTLEPSAQRLEAKGGDSDVEDEETAGGSAGNGFARGRLGDERRSQRGPERAARMRQQQHRLVRLSRAFARYEESRTGLLVLWADAGGACDVSFVLVEDERCVDVLLRFPCGTGELQHFCERQE